MGNCRPLSKFFSTLILSWGLGHNISFPFEVDLQPKMNRTRGTEHLKQNAAERVGMNDDVPGPTVSAARGVIRNHGQTLTGTMLKPPGPREARRDPEQVCRPRWGPADPRLNLESSHRYTALPMPSGESQRTHHGVPRGMDSEVRST